MRVAVDGGKYVGIPREDGTFKVYGVPPGRHFLEVFATGWLFPQLRIAISAGKGKKNPGEISAKYVAETSGTAQEFKTPLVLSPKEVKPGVYAKVGYFQEHPKVSIMSMIFRNPMVLMMGFMGLMAWVMPKMMEGMDPEELKAMQEVRMDCAVIVTPRRYWSYNSAVGDERQSSEQFDI